MCFSFLFYDTLFFCLFYRDETSKTAAGCMIAAAAEIGFDTLFELAGLRRALLYEQRLVILQLLLRTLKRCTLVDALKGSRLHVLYK